MSIKEAAKTLALSYTFHNCEQVLSDAKDTDMSVEEFLEDLLKKEVKQRQQNGIQRRLKEARFPYRRYYADFRMEYLKKEVAAHVKQLESLDFIENKENLILIGNPGTGKTHLAIALGIEACMKRKSVLFVRVPNLVIEIKEAMSLGHLSTYKKKFKKYDLVILDELGYVSFDKECNEILFNLLSDRNDVGSMIVTTNLVFERWNEIFKDPVLTGAIVDRLGHKAHVLDMSGDSYRIRETKEWLK